MERESALGLASEVASTIADPQVRHRGTIGGSLAHGDPASDQLAILLAYEGSVVVRGESGEREIAAAELFQDYLTTAVGDDEVLTEVRLPAMDGYGFGYHKFNRRKEDWAMVAVGALVKKAADGTCEDVRIGLTHMSSVPLRDRGRGGAARQPLDPDSIAAAAEQAAEGTEPPADLNASADYKRHLARVLTKRALTGRRRPEPPGRRRGTRRRRSVHAAISPAGAASGACRARWPSSAASTAAGASTNGQWPLSSSTRTSALGNAARWRSASSTPR